MEITKIGHCCLLIKTKGVTILTDPGAWSSDQNNLTGIDFIVITHEHFDHFHIDSVQQILAHNPDAQIITNSAVERLLKAQQIPAIILEDQQTQDMNGISIAAFGTDHAVIHPDLPLIMNTGYFFDNTFFLPGDAFTRPNVPIKILALPMIAPWMKLVECLDWAISLKPQICLPIHDGMLKDSDWIYAFPAKYLAEHGIQFDPYKPGESREYTSTHSQ